MSWSFAKINGRLAEIFFDEEGKKQKISGHCYVKESEYKTKQEKKWIREDTKRYRFSYRKKIYRVKSDSLLAPFFFQKGAIWPQAKPFKLAKRNIRGPFKTAEELMADLNR